MTLAEKIGQMTQVERENITGEILARHFIGSVLSAAGSVPAPRASAEAWASMVNEMQKGALSTRLGIPIIYGADANHGSSNVYKATLFPHNIGLGATSSWNGVKMHANHFLITDFLKNKLKFRGFVISDWQGIDRITSPPHKNYPNSIATGIRAGIDMVTVPYNYTEFIDDLTSLVENNIVPMSRIDDAVSRILRVKFTMGLFESPFADPSLAGEVGKQVSSKLPMLLAAIPLSVSLWTNYGIAEQQHAIDTTDLAMENATGTTILSAIKAAVEPGTQVVYSEEPGTRVLADKYDYAEAAGDNLNLTIPSPGPSVIRTVCEAVKKCVVIVVSGRPLVAEPYLGDVDALVAAWLPGTEGQGVADVLFGDYGFTGRLPVTWFRSVEQLPMNAGDAHYDPLFPFGFGLATKARK
ncbi:unnamed protein product [Urochloa decumbens]|uniref:Beta-glucosidase n=1 Tax=Urochloa decumbens TaxID=240449 RepID=A0ABC8Y2S7_9POAL